MRIGIDAHIILPQHKHYDPKIARYAEQLITNLIDADTKKEHTWVLFFDDRMKDSKELERFKRPNVEIHHFAFVQYRQYLPVVYSHMLISGFLRNAKLDVFHSPEGLIPFLYPGNIVTSFYYVPRGDSESNLFVRTFMLGAHAAFAQLCKRAKRIIVHKRADQKLLVERHGYPAEQIVLFDEEDLDRVDWPKRIKLLMKTYTDVVEENKKSVKKAKKAKAKVDKKASKAVKAAAKSKKK
jgi:hypothetical protein